MLLRVSLPPRLLLLLQLLLLLLVLLLTMLMQWVWRFSWQAVVAVEQDTGAKLHERRFTKSSSQKDIDHTKIAFQNVSACGKTFPVEM